MYAVAMKREVGIFVFFRELGLNCVELTGASSTEDVNASERLHETA